MGRSADAGLMQAGRTNQLVVEVVDGRGAPVSDCLVELRPPGEGPETRVGTLAETCEAVEFGDILPGDYLLSAQAPGFRRTERPVRLEPGTRTVRLALAEGVVLSGRVVDVEGRGVAGVSVVVSPTSALARSDGAGAFRVFVPSPGVYSVEAHHSDWGGALQKATVPGSPVLLALQPRSVLELAVVSEGRPVSGAQAVLVETKDAGDGRQYAADRTTDADGGVQLKGLPAATYTLEVSLPGALPSVQEVALSERAPTHLTVRLPTVAPGRGGVGEAAPAVEATSGLGQRRYRGRVLDEAHRPVAAFRIGEVRFEADDGRFSLPLLEQRGNVAFTVEAPRKAMATLVRPAGAEDVGDIVLRAAPEVHGLVQAPDGGPAAAALVICEGCRGEGPGERHWTTFTDAEGRFVLSVTGPYGVLVRLLAMKEEQVAWAEAGRVGEEARMRLAAPTQVGGRVLRPNGDPAAGVAVAFLEPLLEPQLLVSGADGRFSGEVPPGLYQVRLLPDSSRPGRTWTVQLPADHPLELVAGAAP